MTRPEQSDPARAVVDLVARAPERAAIFMDFDGTIAEIVDDPTSAAPLPGVLDTLDRLADRVGLLAIVSGRPVAFLADRLERASRHQGIRAFGLYGQEELLPDGSVARDQTGARYRLAFEESAAMAHLAVPDARIEDKGDSVAFHFREAPEHEAALAQVAHHAAVRFGLEVRAGRMVFELVAPDAATKGLVVARHVGNYDVGIGFGDDLGDIAMFVALDAASGRERFSSLKVAVGGAEAPKGLIELADVVVASPIEVAGVLAAIADALEAP
jgi:trehalose 6-phosphate phosphatase